MPDEWDTLPDMAAPAARVADAWDALPDAGAAPQPASPGFIQSVRDHVEPVLNAFGQGFREGFGPERLGVSPEDVRTLSRWGFYAPEGQQSYQNPMHAANELMIETVARTGQIIFRGGSGLFRGGQGVIAEVGAQAGQPQLGRDIAAMPEAFFGSPHPTGRPGAAIAERTRAASVADLTGELARGRVPLEMTLGGQTRLVMLPDGHPIIEFRRDAAEIEKSLPAPDDGFTRLWRGNRPGEVGQNPSFTNSLDGIALPFRKAYGGDLSFVDVPTGDLAKYEAKAGAATGAEFQLPAEIAAQAQAVPYAGFPLSEARSLGVIGPEPARSADSPAREAAMAAVRSGDDVLRGPAPEGEPPPANPWRDRFEHFVGKLETSEDVKTLIREAATTNEEFTAARAGDVPLAHVEGLAEAAGVAPQLIDHTGVGRLMKNDNEVRIGMQLMLQTTDNVLEAARNARDDASPESLIKLQEAIMRRDLAVEQVVGARAEWGRTGRVFQEFMRDVKDQEGLTSFLKDKGRTPSDLQGIADSLGDLDRTQAARVLSDLHQRTPGVFYWTWVNGLISGLLTHTKYVAANALYAASEHGVTTPIAAVIGKAKQVFGADAERVYFGEALAATYGMIAAVPHSLIATAKSIYSGQRAVLKSEIEVHKDMLARGEKVPHVIDQAVNQVTGRGRPEVFQNSDVWGKLSAGDVKGSMVDALGRTIGAPGDMAMGIHTFFKVLGERAGLEAEAYRGAAKEGLSPAEGDFWRRRSEVSENPTTDMRERAIAGAYKGTFMNELGPHGKAWQRMTKETPGLRWLFPFSHIPVNLMKATYEHTPFAFLDAEMRDAITGKKGGVAQDRAIARMVVGSSIMGYFVHQALNGRATGDYPTDPQERDSWKLTGKQPNSILIGNTWVSFGKFGPAGNLANLAANIGYVIPHIGDWWSGKDEEGMTKATFHAARAAANMVADEVGMMSLKMIFEAMHDEKKGAAWASSQAASLIPFSSLLAQTASGGLPGTGGYLGDPYMREARTFFDGLKYKIPGQRETLLPKRDVFGQPLVNPQYGNILRQRQATVDPVLLDMERLQIHPGLPQDRIGGVKLTRPLYDEYQVLAGAMSKTALDNYVSQPGWGQLPPYLRSNMIHETMKNSRETAAAIMQARHTELIGQGMQQRQDYITGKTMTLRPKKAPEPAAP